MCRRFLLHFVEFSVVKTSIHTGSYIHSVPIYKALNILAHISQTTDSTCQKSVRWEFSPLQIKLQIVSFEQFRKKLLTKKVWD